MLGTVLVVILVLMLLGATGPWNSYSAGWGYGPVSGLAGIVFLVLVLMLVTGRL